MALSDNPVIELDLSQDSIPSRRQMAQLLQESSLPIDGLLALHERLYLFEKKYAMRSDEFIDRLAQGELSEQEDWLPWLGLHHASQVLRLRIEDVLIDEQTAPLSRRARTL